MLVERGAGELCTFDPGFGDDAVVTVAHPLVFARWHLGLVERPALRSGAIAVEGPRELCRALPTWNVYPDVRARRRAEHQRAPGSAPPPPPEAVSAVVRPLPRRQHGTTDVPWFGGRLVTPRDNDYDQAPTVWNGVVDRKPRYIAQCLTSSDVAAAIRFARPRTDASRARRRQVLWVAGWTAARPKKINAFKAADARLASTPHE
ncbi:hypothetical protein GCM10009789_35450 [Kribbella sancticallisti]|uniref:Bacteriocin-protection, YdeI or OmpD-Associated n=1 Tax=Kribbella sancticallisti TaxID=460087 RepID=A0ABN2DJG5_9ACTN